MEIRIYANMEAYSGSKPLYVARIEVPSAFDFSNALSVFRSIYGSGVVIVFFCL